ncbi:hypothetical protein Nepgr_026195 [Nepenthes gracilis]|uniref:RNI-like superfamily protein n=1 Tax=Nepenthes gracilis TaxID=150966 RepID=A0AAD3T7S6_NEPGR|nr:hypothetical protein Nepgr_026195 [Nepenthes gracilis]
MEKGEVPKTLTDSFQKLDLNRISPDHKTLNTSSAFQSLVVPFKRTQPPSLVSLCLSIIGKHLEDIIPDLTEIACNFPADIKMAIAAIARRRKLLNDDMIISLADGCWEILDVSCSDVTDSGLAKVSEICRSLFAVDISQCSNINLHGITQLMQHCSSLKILRCGGCPRSDYTAHRCLDILKPKLNDGEGDSWEELDSTQMAHGAQSLRWFIWPKIDHNSLENFATECPRIIVNPQPPSPFGFKGIHIPREALPGIVLDDPIVKDIDPSTWAVTGQCPEIISRTISMPTGLSIAEKFRLAFVERDVRLAPKRAKNARQRQRRAEREWVMTSTEAKAVAIASQVSRSLRGRN